MTKHSAFDKILEKTWEYNNVEYNLVINANKIGFMEWYINFTYKIFQVDKKRYFDVIQSNLRIGKYL